MKKVIAQLWSDENGQDLTEYALLLALLALGAIATVHGITTTLNNVFQNAATSISTATSG